MDLQATDTRIVWSLLAAFTLASMVLLGLEKVH